MILAVFDSSEGCIPILKFLVCKIPNGTNPSAATICNEEGEKCGKQTFDKYFLVW